MMDPSSVSTPPQRGQWKASGGLHQASGQPPLPPAVKVGGIAANNASGMCCGTAQNSYRTLVSMRVMLADGTLVDTGDAASREAFARSHAALLGRLTDLAARTRADAPRGAAR